MSRDDIPVGEALRWLVNQPQGRAAVRWLMRVGGYADTTFHPQNSQMSFNEGRRSLAVELLQTLRSADEDIFTRFIGDLL